MSLRNETNNPSFQEIGQAYINVNEENANVNFLTTKARESFHDETISLSHYGQNLPFLEYCLSSLKSFSICIPFFV